MTKLTAEESFYSAFTRLKTNTTMILPKHSEVTQNNVAREAGCDPSALRKSRYPRLIDEIKLWISQNGSKRPESLRQEKLKQRERNRSLREEINLLKAERDSALSLLMEADARILELFIENQRLKATQPKTNVLPMR
ncbi:hypothetical protein [Pseudomonas mohnii]